jgi:hypothetical protein
MYRGRGAGLLRGMSYFFTESGVLRRPFGFLAGAAGYTLVALLGLITR